MIVFPASEDNFTSDLKEENYIIEIETKEA